MTTSYAMPAEFESHAATLMAWPTRRELWTDQFDQAKADYATVATAIARYEPVVMVCNPGSSDEVRALCGHGVASLELPINDSWARDSGPNFVRGVDGDVAVMSFVFNAWGERWHPHDDDARLAERIAEVFDLPLLRSPLVLEGGAFLLDGAGTLITTEQCVLNDNRNPTLSRSEIEDALCLALGVSTVIWIPHGHSTDVGPEGTDGHLDGVLQYLAPGRVLLELPTDADSPEFHRSRANETALLNARDARGRALEIVPLDPGPDATVSYINHYIVNGAVIVPVDGNPGDAHALATLSDAYPDREVVAVPGATLAYGGGGPHCITQQIPAGVTLPASLA